MALEGVLSSQHRQSLVIDNFIFHIIEAGSEEPVYLNTVALSDGQRQFFTKRICDASQGGQYLFAGEENGPVQQDCKEILDDAGANFVQASRRLASEFHRLHRSHMSSGG